MSRGHRCAECGTIVRSLVDHVRDEHRGAFIDYLDAHGLPRWRQWLPTQRAEAHSEAREDAVAG